MRYSRLALAVGAGLGLALLWLGILPGASEPALAQDGSLLPPTLARSHAPVVISGGACAYLLDSPLDDLYVYVYQGGAPQPIPFQVDERDVDGIYVVLEDGRLDQNDELVFMAADGGEWVANPQLEVGGRVIAPTYVVTVTDPLSQTHAWFYLFRSSRLTQTSSADYVAYDPAGDRISSPGRYDLGFDANRSLMDYLTLGGDGTDLLDRNKLRLQGSVQFGGFDIPFSINEDQLIKGETYALDGPVRVTRVSSNSIEVGGESLAGRDTLFAYRSLMVQPATLPVPEQGVEVDYVRVSLDWNAEAVGSTFYDANNPAGVPIDGVPDGISTTPASRWGQVSSDAGGLLRVTNLPEDLGASQSTYYKDDATFDGGDTGDQVSYGDAGLQVSDLNPGAYILMMRTYFMSGEAGNLGEAYVALYDHPLQVALKPLLRFAYLPVVVKGSAVAR